VEQSPVSILITDTDGKIEYVNSFFTQVTGWQAKEVIGKKTISSNLAPLLKNSIRIYGTAYPAEKPGKENLTIVRKTAIYTGRGYDLATYKPFRKIINYIAVKEDITQRKRITAELVQAKEAAEQMNRIKKPTSWLA
jgi:PAS domain S-box-containing protein